METNGERRRSKASGQQNNDVRDAYRRDRDRIFYSEEFRRLEGVTQVATGDSQHVHNRMTHSSRVEQVARAIALTINQKFPNVFIDEHVVAAAALAHDLGHPPFGHNGEEALQEVLVCKKHRKNSTPETRDADQTFCRKCFLRDSFEGNAQTFHILTLLAETKKSKVSETDDGQRNVSVGLDLTRQTLRATLKYPWRYGAQNINRERYFSEEKSQWKSVSKWEVYDCDRYAFSWVYPEDPSPRIPDITAQVMDISDDIAYAAHDIEDFYRLGVIPLWEISPQSTLCDKLIDYFSTEATAAMPQVLRDLAKDYEASLADLERVAREKTDDASSFGDFTSDVSSPTIVGEHHKVAALRDLCAKFTELGRYEDNSESISRLVSFRSWLITELISNLQIENDILGYADQKYDLWIEFLKQLTWYFVIDNPKHYFLVYGQKKAMKRCFLGLYQHVADLWITGRDRKRKTPGDNERWSLSDVDPKTSRSIPPLLISYYLKNKGLYEADEAKHDRGRSVSAVNMDVKAVIARTVVDYICSLNDTELEQMDRQLQGVSSTSDFLLTLY